MREPAHAPWISTVVALRAEFGRVRRPFLGMGVRWGELARAQAQDIQNGKLVMGRSGSGRVRRMPIPPEILVECQGRIGRVSPFRDSCSFNKRVRLLSSIGRFHAHLCRHNFAAEWRESGCSLAALQAVLGHGSVAVTGRDGTVDEDLAKHEALRLVQYRAQAQGQGWSGEGAPQLPE